MGAAGQPAFQGTWVNNTSGNATLAFCRVGPWVKIRGTIKGGADTTTVFTLPGGYRPPALIAFACPIINGTPPGVGAVAVDSAGNVTWYNVTAGSGTTPSLDNVTFMVD